MPTQQAIWQANPGPLIALGVALGLALASRFLRSGVLAAAAGGTGVAAGWYAITGRLWVVPPPVTVDALTEFAVIALLIGLLCSWLGAGRWTVLALLIAALVAGWFLSGAPRHQAALRASWPIGLGVAIAVGLFGRILATPSLEPPRLALAAFTLAAALQVAGAPPVWIQLALVPGFAALAMLALPPMPGLVALPVAVDIAALACLVCIALGRVPRLGFVPADAAVLSPLLALWLAPRITEWLRFIGRLAALTGGSVALAVAVGGVWLLRRLL